MSPETTNQNNFLQTLPPTVRARVERLSKNFRYVGPATKTDAITKKYPNVAYTIARQLPEEIVTDLASKATPGCYKCQGSGIKDWRAQGLKARVCKCVLDQERFDAALEEFAKAYEKLEAEQTQVQG
jgi:hypothetical protein